MRLCFIVSLCQSLCSAIAPPLSTACIFRPPSLIASQIWSIFNKEIEAYANTHTRTHRNTHSHTHTNVIRQGVGTYNLFFNEKDNVYVMGCKRGCDGVERDSCGQFGNTEMQWGTRKGTQGDGQTMSQWKWHKCLIQDIWIFHKDMTHIQNKARASPKNDYNVPQWVCAYVCECVWISAGNRILLLSCR